MLVKTSCRGLWEQPGAERAAVPAVAVTTQRGTVVNVGKNGRPLRPAITWLDQRRAGTVPPTGPFWRATFKAARVAGTVDYFRSGAEIN